MKRNLFNFIVVVVLLMVVAIACIKDKVVTGVTLDYDTLELVVDETITLTATVKPSDATNKVVKWTSSAPEVATVVEGAVTARAEGVATITVTTNDGEFTAICVVTVVTPIPIEPVMIHVAGGTFIMGCTDGQCERNETPVLNVKLDDYYIAKYPVTQREWRAIMRNNPSLNKGDNNPVENINWDDVTEFLERLNNATGKKYRLATEAEWEYAARGGNKSQGYRYSGSSNIDVVAWYSGNSFNDNGKGATQPVGQKTPNELGICDMSGNVWEWCDDFYARYDSVRFRTGFDTILGIWVNPRDTVGIQRVARGGSYLDDIRFCRVSARYAPTPPMMSGHLGIRLAMSVE